MSSDAEGAEQPGDETSLASPYARPVKPAAAKLDTIMKVVTPVALVALFLSLVLHFMPRPTPGVAPGPTITPVTTSVATTPEVEVACADGAVTADHFSFSTPVGWRCNDSAVTSAVVAALTKVYPANGSASIAVSAEPATPDSGDPLTRAQAFIDRLAATGVDVSEAAVAADYADSVSVAGEPAVTIKGTLTQTLTIQGMTSTTKTYLVQYYFAHQGVLYTLAAFDIAGGVRSGVVDDVETLSGYLQTILDTWAWRT